MLGVTDLWTYVLGTIAIVLLPGPNSLYVLSTAARHGVRMGYRAAMGVFVGDWILMVAAAAGVASLLKAYPPLFMIIKYAGGAYLTFVGVQMAVAAIRRWRGREQRTAASARPANETNDETGGGADDGAMDSVTSSGKTDGGVAVAGEAKNGPNPPAGKPFRRALLISLLNPKAILFLISFFIQFIDPDYPNPALPFLLLAVILEVCSALYLSALIFSGTFLATQFRRRRRLASGLAGGIGVLFVSFGIRLATASIG